MGRAKSLDHTLVTTNGQIRRYKGKLLKPVLSSNGYLHIAVYVNSNPVLIHLHQAVALLFKGPRPRDWDVRHKNSIRTDNRATNIEYCTRSQNIADALACGNMKKRASHVGSKPIARVDINGQVLKVFSNCREVEEIEKVNRGSLYRVLRGIKQSTKGMIFKRITKKEYDTHHGNAA